MSAIRETVHQMRVAAVQMQPNLGRVELTSYATTLV